MPSFASVYETYHGRIRAYAAKLIGHDDADDVAQEVFIKVERALPGLEEPAKLASWIFAIALNTVRDLARSRASKASRSTHVRASRPGDSEADDILARVPDSRAPGPEEAAMRDQMVACYLDYVEKLSPNYYDVYVLAELEELQAGEIARRLSLTVGTVKIRLHRARTRLYEELRRDCQCFWSDRGELLARPKEPTRKAASPAAPPLSRPPNRSRS